MFRVSFAKNRRQFCGWEIDILSFFRPNINIFTMLFYVLASPKLCLNSWCSSFAFFLMFIEQEKELIERHNAWLNDELTAKVNNLNEIRGRYSELEAEMASKLSDVRSVHLLIVFENKLSYLVQLAVAFCIFVACTTFR